MIQTSFVTVTSRPMVGSDFARSCAAKKFGCFLSLSVTRSIVKSAEAVSPLSSLEFRNCFANVG